MNFGLILTVVRVCLGVNFRPSLTVFRSRFGVNLPDFDYI